MKMWFKNKQKLVFMAFGVVFIVTPIIVYILSVVPIFPSGGNDWAGFWGGYLGAIFAGFIALYIFYMTLKDNKENLERTFEENRRHNEHVEMIEYCESLIDRLKKVSELIFDVMLAYEKFLYSAKEMDKYEAIKIKNICADEVWAALIRLESKKGQLKKCEVIIKDLNDISNIINSFNINSLNYCRENVDVEIIDKMVNSEEFVNMRESGKEVAQSIEDISKSFTGHMRQFYNINTKFDY